MRTASRPGPQPSFNTNIVEFPVDEKILARKFAIAKRAIIKALRRDKRVPGRNRASVQNYFCHAVNDCANKVIFYRTGHLVFWEGTTGAADALGGMGRDTIMRCRRILENLSYFDLLEAGQAGSGCSNLFCIRDPAVSLEPMLIDDISFARNVARECGRIPAKSGTKRGHERSRERSHDGTFFGGKKVPRRDMNVLKDGTNVLRADSTSGHVEGPPYGGPSYESEDPGFGFRNEYSDDLDIPDDIDGPYHDAAPYENPIETEEPSPAHPSVGFPPAEAAHDAAGGKLRVRLFCACGHSHPEPMMIDAARWDSDELVTWVDGLTCPACGVRGECNLESLGPAARRGHGDVSETSPPPDRRDPETPPAAPTAPQQPQPMTQPAPAPARARDDDERVSDEMPDNYADDDSPPRPTEPVRRWVWCSCGFEVDQRTTLDVGEPYRTRQINLWREGAAETTCPKCHKTGFMCLVVQDAAGGDIHVELAKYRDDPTLDPADIATEAESAEAMRANDEARLIITPTRPAVRMAPLREEADDDLDELALLCGGGSLQ